MPKRDDKRKPDLADLQREVDDLLAPTPTETILPPPPVHTFSPIVVFSDDDSDFIITSPAQRLRRSRLVSDSDGEDAPLSFHPAPPPLPCIFLINPRKWPHFLIVTSRCRRIQVWLHPRHPSLQLIRSTIRWTSPRLPRTSMLWKLVIAPPRRCPNLRTYQPFSDRVILAVLRRAKLRVLPLLPSLPLPVLNPDLAP